MKILAIETSCDETSAAVAENSRILSNVVSSQVDLHRKYGGVYPELAARAHLENIIPVLKAALKQAGTDLSEIDLIAVTVGPGLIGSLLVGANTAKSLAYSFNKPIIGINHLEGHIYSVFGGVNSKFQIPNSKQFFPAMALIVSGGHTSLILMRDYGKYQVVGQTRDDAAGEAFDKVAALLGLPYPGGPSIEKAAQVAKLKSTFPRRGSAAETDYEKGKINLPRPMIDSPDFDFSFSGLKTAVRYLIQQITGGRPVNVRRPIKFAVAAEFQQAVIDVLVAKTLKAARKYKVKSIVLAGGVAANQSLRRQLKLKMLASQNSLRNRENLLTSEASTLRGQSLKINFLVPPKNLCTDNAVMVALAAYYQTLKKKPEKWYNIIADANAKLTS